MTRPFHAPILVQEMPCAGEAHAHFVLIGGLDDILVLHRTAGLEGGGGSAFVGLLLPRLPQQIVSRQCFLLVLLQ